MAEITGVLQDIKSRPVSGGKTGYDIVVAGQSYGYGLYAPKAKVGEYVKFNLDESRGYKNVERNSLKVSSHKPPAEAVAEAEKTMIKTSEGSVVDQRQDTISRQSARNTAVDFLALAASQDALGLPAAGAKGKRLETLEGMLEKYTQEFYESNTGAKWKDITPDKVEDTVEAPEVVADAPAPTDEKWT